MRARHNFTQAQAAKKAKIALRTWSRAESGGAISSTAIEKIAVLFDADPATVAPGYATKRTQTPQDRSEAPGVREPGSQGTAYEAGRSAASSGQSGSTPKDREQRLSRMVEDLSAELIELKAELRRVHCDLDRLKKDVVE